MKFPRFMKAKRGAASRGAGRKMIANGFSLHHWQILRISQALAMTFRQLPPKMEGGTSTPKMEARGGKSTAPAAAPRADSEYSGRALTCLPVLPDWLFKSALSPIRVGPVWTGPGAGLIWSCE